MARNRAKMCLFSRRLGPKGAVFEPQIEVMVLFIASITLAFMDASIAGNRVVKLSSPWAIIACAASATMACIYSVAARKALLKAC